MQSAKLFKKICHLTFGIGHFYQRGYSIVELLVVVAVFSIIALIATQAVVLVLRGSRKSESLISVRENVDYAFSVMERSIRNAQALNVNCNSDSTTLDYIDGNGGNRNFSCLGGASGYIASDSARLTSDNVNVDCTQTPIFACFFPASGSEYVDISVTASDASAQGAEGAKFTTSTRILLRTY